MKLIIGGAYQGKRQYALEYYKNEALAEDFHLTVLELVKNDIDPVDYINERMSEYMDKVVICDDIFCGVVPADPLARRWREALGAVLSVLTRECDEVVRVFCGLGIRLK